MFQLSKIKVDDKPPQIYQKMENGQLSQIPFEIEKSQLTQEQIQDLPQIQIKLLPFSIAVHLEGKIQIFKYYAIRNEFLKIMFKMPSIDIHCKDRHGINGFWLASFYNQPVTVQLLYNTKIDIFVTNNSGSNSLHIAVKKSLIEVIKVLLNECKYPINKMKNNGETALMIAVINNNPQIVQMLLQYNSDPNITSKTGIGAVQLALKNPTLECLQVILQARPSLYYSDPFRIENSPLFFAIRQGKVQALQFMLLQNNLDIDKIMNLQELSLIHYAFNIKNDEIVAFLVTKQNNLEQEDPNKFTLLMKYLMTQNVKMADYLVQKGANINYQNQDGNSALHICLQNKELQGAQYLIRNHVNPHSENNQGLDCCDIAKEKETFQIKYNTLHKCKYHKSSSNRAFQEAHQIEVGWIHLKQKQYHFIEQCYRINLNHNHLHKVTIKFTSNLNLETPQIRTQYNKTKIKNNSQDHKVHRDQSDYPP
eukprot:403352187